MGHGAAEGQGDKGIRGQGDKSLELTTSLSPCPQFPIPKFKIPQLLAYGRWVGLIFWVRHQ
jgi:hypothetical protein